MCRALYEIDEYKCDCLSDSVGKNCEPSGNDSNNGFPINSVTKVDTVKRRAGLLTVRSVWLCFNQTVPLIFWFDNQVKQASQNSDHNNKLYLSQRLSFSRITICKLLLIYRFGFWPLTVCFTVRSSPSYNPSISQAVTTMPLGNKLKLTWFA